MSKLDRHTLFIEDEAMTIAQVPTRQGKKGSNAALHDQKSPLNKQQLPNPMDKALAKRIPVKKTDAEILIPVVSGSPWHHYEKRYTVKHWCLFAVATSKADNKRLYMIRTLSNAKNDEYIRHARQLFHPNLVQNIEIYASTDDSNFIVSEMMNTSLLHVSRAPQYPSESQLSSILFQVLSGLEYLMSNGLVHEGISCASILINTVGEVKISDIETCRQKGDINKLLDSLSRVTMLLMDKEKSRYDTLGLSDLDRWSSQAVDMFTLMSSQPSLTELASHSFWEKKDKGELKWLVHLTLITAYHCRG